MRFRRSVVGVLALSVVGVALVSCKQQVAQSPAPNEEPLLLLEEGEDRAGRSSSKGPAADNGRCHVCHMNYEEEKLAVRHAKAGVGCEKCHGASDAHCNDEDNITPPEIMYPKAKVNPACMTCHPKGKIDIKAHKPVLKALAEAKKLCTDCHGKHRLERRTPQWDKATGKLIESDKD